MGAAQGKGGNSSRGAGFMWFWVGGRKRGSRGIWLLRISRLFFLVEGRLPTGRLGGYARGATCYTM